MKHIYLNLKRFDISPAHGGVNRLAPTAQWGAAIVRRTQDALAAYAPEAVEFVMYLPEAHLLPAAAARAAPAARYSWARRAAIGRIPPSAATSARSPRCARPTPWPSWAARAC